MVMGSAWRRNNRRQLRHSLGRYLAILAIVALGVGFFTGIKAAQPAMLKTDDRYLRETAFFDFRLVSTLGMTEEDAAYFASLDGVATAEGANSVDLIVSDGRTERTLKAHSLSDTVNRPSLTEGRLPTAADECLGDSELFSAEDLGTVLTVAETAQDGLLTAKEFTLVGLCELPLYLGVDRGTTTLGGGTLNGFLVVPPECFADGSYTELYLTVRGAEEMLYSDAYDEAMEALRPTLETALAERAQQRYEDLLSLLSDYTALPDLALAAPAPETYVLDRESNSGYVSFRNDTSIVEGIAKIFPLFFFAVAALVCMTTMTRMIDEQRTQIGTLKALGYSDGAIAWKYMSYSGSAALIGCLLGYALGTWLFPLVIWMGYSLLYDFAPLEYVFEPFLAVVSVLAALLCSAGVTWLACRTELRRMPASLMRPKTPKAGKRIWLERVPFIWNRFPFLHKVSIRNIVRYKKRLIMMLLGIGGCTVLIVAGLGLRDSISTVVDDQFEGVTCYQLSVRFSAPLDEARREEFRAAYPELPQCVFVETSGYEAQTSRGFSAVNIVATDDPAITEAIKLHDGDRTVAYPAEGAVIDRNLADALNIGAGDMLTLRLNDTETVELPVADVFDNYVYHYAFMTAESYETYFGAPCEYATAYLCTDGDPYALGAALSGEPEVAAVTVSDALREMVDNTMQSLDYIIALVVGCACALALVVLFNLCNISITERVREIATVKVLGFYPLETRLYVFREILLLTTLGALLGLPCGKLLHRYIMEAIRIDMVSFHIHVTPLSYALAFGITLLLGGFVCLCLTKKIDRIHMAESLKSVE